VRVWVKQRVCVCVWRVRARCSQNARRTTPNPFRYGRCRGRWWSGETRPERKSGKKSNQQVTVWRAQHTHTRRLLLLLLSVLSIITIESRDGRKQQQRDRRRRRWFRCKDWILSSTCPRIVSHHRKLIRDFIERRKKTKWKVKKRSYEVSVVIHGRRSRSCCCCLLVACAVAVARRGWNVPKHSRRRRLRPNTALTADPHHGSRRRLQQRCEYATTASAAMVVRCAGNRPLLRKPTYSPPPSPFVYVCVCLCDTTVARRAIIIYRRRRRRRRRHHRTSTGTDRRVLTTCGPGRRRCRCSDDVSGADGASVCVCVCARAHNNNNNIIIIVMIGKYFTRVFFLHRLFNCSWLVFVRFCERN